MAEADYGAGSSMGSAFRAGLSYFAIVFGLGFLFGIFRFLVLLPVMSETVAVVLELPPILFLSWIVARRLIRKFCVSAKLSSRLVMGCLAFALLMLGEAALSVFAFRRSFIEHLVHYTETSALLGLAGQVAFSMFPAIQLAVPTRKKLPVGR